jgi:deazaflavin-dependent oxidoreductase (nitroreductase family)
VRIRWRHCGGPDKVRHDDAHMTPPRPVLKLFWSLHLALRRVTGGRLGTSTPHDDRVGTLFLHTVGRRSGQPRINALFYLIDGADLVVVASNAGADTDPAWWLNLLDRPDAEVEIGGQRRSVRARAATDPETERLWARLVAGNPEYAAYRAKARRPIPIVILESR